MPLAITISDPAGTFAAFHADIESTLQSAWAAWTVDFTKDAGIEIGVAFSNISGLAEATASVAVQTGTSGGFAIFQNGVLQELNTGVDPNGATVDGVITIDTEIVAQLAFGDAPTPSNRYDADTLLAHELGHILGITSLRDDTNQLTGTSITTFDQLVGEGSNGLLRFLGGSAYVTQLGATPLADKSHLNVTDDLMTAGLAQGEERAIGALDIAILTDIGAPLPKLLPTPVNLFDQAFYLAQNPDIAAAGVDAATHFNEFGWKEGRDPNVLFDTSFYLAQNPDVAAAGVNPLTHYLFDGGAEGRDPSAAFDSSLYFDSNPDVAAAGANPLNHYLLFGAGEKRLAPAPETDSQALVGIADQGQLLGLG